MPFLDERRHHVEQMLRTHGEAHGVLWSFYQRLDRPDMWLCWQLDGRLMGTPAQISFMFNALPTDERLSATLQQGVMALIEAFRRYRELQSTPYSREEIESRGPAVRVDGSGEHRVRRGETILERQRHPENPAIRLDQGDV